jgi:hypothetical protein
MIELPNNYGATPPELSTGGSAPVDPVPLLEPQREILTRPLPSHAELLQMYGTLQDDLARYGITKATVDQQYALDSALCRIHRLDLFDPRLDALLEQLHVEAYAGVKPRPARLMARDGVMSLEDITVDLEG